MALRTHEIHPTLVHFPLTLIPAAMIIDAVGRYTNNQNLMNVGKTMMPIAAASALVTGAAGYIAQGAVKAEGHAHDLLVTHRNLNTALVAITTGMAIARQRMQQPGVGYLLAGLSGMLAMSYTAYIGGKMVYAHGVGVEPDGVNLEASPEIRRGSFGVAARRAMTSAGQQIRASAQEIARGELAPAVRTHAQRIAHPERAHQPPDEAPFESAARSRNNGSGGASPSPSGL